MKTSTRLLLVLLFSTSNFAFAQSQIDTQTRLTESQCEDQRLSNIAIASEIIKLIAHGANDGRGNKTCIDRSYEFLVLPGSPSEDVDTTVLKSELIENENQVRILSVRPVSDPLENLYLVHYRLQLSNGEAKRGTFTFSRFYGQDAINQMGCGLIQEPPSISFLKKACL